MEDLDAANLAEFPVERILSNGAPYAVPSRKRRYGFDSNTLQNFYNNQNLQPKVTKANLDNEY